MSRADHRSSDTRNAQVGLGSDVTASVALAGFSVAVAAGFARVFSGWEFLDNLIVVVIVGHGVGLVFRRLGVSAWLAVPVTLVILGWTIGMMHYRFTYAWGLPTGDTWTLLRAEFELIQDQFSIAVAPVPFGAGWDVLAGVGIALAVVLADVFAFRAFARAEALVPGGVLFVFVGALGSDRLRVTLTVLVVATGVIATIVLRAYHAPGPTRSRRRAQSTLRILAPAGLAITILVAATAGFVGPRLPGADAAPIYETRGGGGGNVTTLVSPLVDIKSRLTNRTPIELFVVDANFKSYWRASALPSFDGRRWELPDSDLERADEELALPRPGTAELRQQVRVVNLTGQLIPAAPDFVGGVQTSRDDVQWLRDTSTLITTDGDLEPGDTIELVSASPQFDAAQLAAATSTDAGDPIYLEVPANLPPVVAETAAAVTDGATSPFDKAIALEAWFKDPDEFSYSLEVQPGHGNSEIESFLRERSGYCEQFAGTYAAMMRTLGIPSRVSVGYTFGDQITATTYSVLGRNAHAWPEVWFDGIGWMPFEPTPGRGNPTAEIYTGRAPEQDTSGFDTEAQEETDPAVAPTTLPGIDDPSDPGLNLPTEDLLDPTTEDPALTPTESDDGGQLALWLAVVGLVALLLALPALVRRVRARRVVGSTEQQLGRLWRRSLDALGDVGVPQDSARTPLETAAVTAHQFPIAARPIGSLAEAVTVATYQRDGTADFEVAGAYGASTMRECRSWCRQIERAVNDSIGFGDRVRRYFTRWG